MATALLPSLLQQSQEADQVDYSSWPVKELRRFLTERGVDPSSIVEKSDLVSQARQRPKFVCHRIDEGLLGLGVILLCCPALHWVGTWQLQALCGLRVIADAATPCDHLCCRSKHWRSRALMGRSHKHLQAIH